MPNKTERELRRELKELRESKSAGGDDVNGEEITVEWRDADPESRPEGMSWDAETATLSYDAWSSQREFLTELDDDSTDLAAFLAGYGSGKSVAGARWILTHAIRNPGSSFLAMGTTYSQAQHTTFQTLFQSLPGEETDKVTSDFNGPESSPLIDDYNRAEHRVTLTNGSTITLGSADKWSRYAGAEYGGVWMDEPSFYGADLHDLLEMIVGRLRGVSGPKSIAWTLTGNGYNDAWEILEKRQDSNGEPLGTEISLIRASTLENPFLEEEELDRYERNYMGGQREEQALHGGFQAAQGLVYSEFRRDTHVIPHTRALDRRDGSWRVYGYDSGFKDPRVVLEVARSPQNQLIVLNEFHEEESHVEAAIEWLDRRPDGTIITEHAPSDEKRFQKAGWSTKQADKAIEAGIADVQRRLEEDEHTQVEDTGSSFTGQRTVPIAYDSGPDYGRDADGSASPDESETDDVDEDGGTKPTVGLLVSEKCTNLIQEFLSYKEDDIGSSGARDHCLDALRYVVHTSESSVGSGGDRGDRPDHHGVRWLD